MGWAENHLDSLPGIESATNKRLPGCFTCQKCGDELGGSDHVRALIVRYTLPREWSRVDGMGVHTWSILCRDCEVDLSTRAAERPDPAGPAPWHSLS